VVNRPAVVLDMTDDLPVSAWLRRFITQRRRAFLDEAVRRRIITPKQATQLMALHAEGDAELDAREKAHGNDP